MLNHHTETWQPCPQRAHKCRPLSQAPVASIPEATSPEDEHVAEEVHAEDAHTGTDSSPGQVQESQEAEQAINATPAEPQVTF